MHNQNRSMFGAVAEAIKALCYTLISLFGVLNKSVSIADKAVSIAAEKQAVDAAIDMEGYETRAREQAELASLQSADALALYVGDDADRKARHAEIRARLSKAIQEAKAGLA